MGPNCVILDISPLRVSLPPILAGSHLYTSPLIIDIESINEYLFKDASSIDYAWVLKVHQLIF